MRRMNTFAILRHRTTRHQRRNLTTTMDVGQVQAARRRHGQCFSTRHCRHLLTGLHQSIKIKFVRITLSSNLAHNVLVVVISAMQKCKFLPLKKIVIIL